MVKFSDGVWAEARARYERGDEPVVMIGAALGISGKRIWTRAREEGWLRPAAAALLPPDEEKLLARLFRAFERQVAELEQRFAAGSEGGVEERDARMLAVLAKTFETLAKLREGRGEDLADAMEEGGDVDLDELRLRLARRLDALGGAGGDAGEPAAGDDGGALGA